MADCDRLRERDPRFSCITCCIACHAEDQDEGIPLEPFDFERRHYHVCCDIINAIWKYGIRENDPWQTPHDIVGAMVAKLDTRKE